MTEPEPELEEGAVVPLSPLEPELDEPEEPDFELLELELPDELDPEFAAEPEEPELEEPEPEDVEPDEDAVVRAEAGRVAATPAVVRTLASPAAAVIRRSLARLRSRVLIAAPAVPRAAVPRSRAAVPRAAVPRAAAPLAGAAGSCVIAHLPGC